ncbi:MAG: YHS domain-containing protein [Candidatus Aenigmarchaeota archaeon]|nr:YHS domain-containing protein [Candidatus Aenigmarchaeota archaeon]
MSVSIMGKDPVCGMEVGRSKLRESYRGRTYYFCSSHCREAFRKSPGKFAAMKSKNNSVSHFEGGAPTKPGLKAYAPLAVVIGLILLVTVVASVRDHVSGGFAAQTTISYFMIEFFVVFAGFKLIDLKGFAEGYSTYDLLAGRVFAYGYVYPFIELFFGLAMILYPTSAPLLLAEILVMGFSGIGVAIKLLKKEKFYCACLGTFLKVPLTKITIIEDFGMAALALIMLFA